MRYTSLSLLFLCASSWASAQGWNLVWADEFNGTQLDTTQWNYDIGSGSQYGLWGWGGNESQHYLASNAEVSNGTLKLIAKQEPGGLVDSWGNTRYYSSAKVTTQNKYEFRYGKVEARMKTIEGEGYWPAFWMLPKGINNLLFPGLHCWPLDGEIDIMEQWAGDGPTSVTSGAAHVGDMCGGGSFYQVWHTQIASGSFADDFHLYGVEWKEDTISWFLDQVKQYSVSPSDYSGNWPFNVNEWYLMFNLAITNSGPNANTVFPNQVEIDYVRVYESVAGVMGCTDPLAQNYDPAANAEDGTCKYDVEFVLDLNCSGISPDSVHVTSSSINWACNSYTLTDPENDGIWTGTFAMPKGTFEYIYCTDGWTETEGPGLIADMVNGATCAPITDFTNYANRLIDITAPMSVYNTWATCEPLVYGCTDVASANYNPAATCDDGSCEAINTGLNGTIIQEFSLYPNPARDLLQVRFRSQHPHPLQLRLLNLLGERVYSKQIAGHAGTHNLTIPVAQLPAGIYLLEIITSAGSVQEKVVLQK